MFQELVASGSTFSDKNGKGHVYGMWMRRMRSPLPAIRFNFKDVTGHVAQFEIFRGKTARWNLKPGNHTGISVTTLADIRRISIECVNYSLQ
jgi:hypothetical protein